MSQSRTDIDLSIIIPAKDDGLRLDSTLGELANYLTQHYLGEIEVVVAANTHSKDNTLAVAKAKAKLFKHYQVAADSFPGKGEGVRYGVLKARGRYRLFMDADLATPLHHLATVKYYMDHGQPIVIGVRNLGVIHTGLRKFISTFGNLLIRFIIRLKINDTQCGFKAFRADVAEDIFTVQTIAGWGFDMELLAIAKHRGYTVQTMAIDDWQDVAGGTFNNVATQAALSTFKDLLRIRSNLKRGVYEPGSKHPTHLKS